MDFEDTVRLKNIWELNVDPIKSDVSASSGMPKARHVFCLHYGQVFSLNIRTILLNSVHRAY